jgi:L-iditol 2-dehydrogenase
MRIGVYYGPGDVRVEEGPVPTIGEDEMLVETTANALCAGEAMEWYSKKAGGKILGHEPVGLVAAVGDEVDGFELGDRVFVNHHVGRMNSHWAIRGRYTKDPYYKSTRLDPGSMADYFRVSAAHLRADVHHVPESISDEAATTIEPWSCVLGGLKQCMIQPGDTVAVVGAGFMGLGFVHMAPLFGAGSVISLDFSDWRLEKARELGATHTIGAEQQDPAEALRDLNRGLLADVVVAAAPSIAAWKSAYALVEDGGTLHLAAPSPPGSEFTLDGADAYFREVTVNSKYSADHRDTYQYIRLLESGRVDPSPAITHLLPFEELPRGFELLESAGESLKIVIRPGAGISGRS